MLTAVRVWCYAAHLCNSPQGDRAKHSAVSPVQVQILKKYSHLNREGLRLQPKASRRGRAGKRWGSIPLSLPTFYTCGNILPMNQVLTLVVRLQPDSEQYAKLKDTATEFASCCEFINSSVKPTLTNRNSIQAVIYNDAKNKFNLVSNHIIRACARVGANRLTAKYKGKKVKGFKPTSFDCDKDTFTFREKEWTVSLSTVRGRERISLNVSNYHRGKLAGQKPTSATVCLHSCGNFYVHIQLKSQAPKSNRTTNVIGVDFGRREIAKTSTEKGWDGKQINQIRDKYARVRASLERQAYPLAQGLLVVEQDRF